MKELIKKLNRIQTELNAPKNQRNKFGNYNYRSCEDILAAAKPLLKREGLVLGMKDEIELVGDRYYVKATASVFDSSGEMFFSTAYAREQQDKKGMDAAQVTGAASSYARKYALNGLFAIDDTKDADGYDNRPSQQSTATSPAPKSFSPQKATPGGKKVSDKQVKYIAVLFNKYFEANGVAKPEWPNKKTSMLKDYYSVESTKDLSISQASEIIERLNKQIDSLEPKDIPLEDVLPPY